MENGTRASAARRGARIERAIAAAAEVFLRHGFAATRMDDIADQAGISKATLYNYFPDKTALFLKMVSRHSFVLAGRLLDHVEPEWGAERALHAAGQQILRHLTSQRRIALLRLCLGEAERFPDLGQKYLEVSISSVRGQVERLLGALAAQGALRLPEPCVQLAAAQFVMLCHSDLVWRCMLGVARDLPDHERDKVVNAAVRMFLSCYGPQEAALPPAPASAVPAGAGERPAPPSAITARSAPAASGQTVAQWLNRPGGYAADCPRGGFQSA